MTLLDLDTIVAELGPDWRWLVRGTHPDEEKPGRYLANVVYHGENGRIFFPVFADTAIEAFNESFRRAALWQKEGVR